MINKLMLLIVLLLQGCTPLVTVTMHQSNRQVDPDTTGGNTEVLMERGTDAMSQDRDSKEVQDSSTTHHQNSGNSADKTSVKTDTTFKLK